MSYIRCYMDHNLRGYLIDWVYVGVLHVLSSECFCSLFSSLQTDRNTLPKKGLEYVKTIIIRSSI